MRRALAMREMRMCLDENYTRDWDKTKRIPSIVVVLSPRRLLGKAIRFDYG